MNAQEDEKEAVPNTIMRSWPRGSGPNSVAVPRGIEVLIKKAAVDREFRERLIEQRGGAASDIGLELDPAENAMLSVIPCEQLAQIIGQTTVPLEQRRVFLGRIAAAMLAVLGAGLSGCERSVAEGIRPDRPERSRTNTEPVVVPPPPPPAGIRPDPPSPSPPSTKPPPQSFLTQGIRPDHPGLNRSDFP